MLFYSPRCPGSQLVLPVMDAAARRAAFVLDQRRQARAVEPDPGTGPGPGGKAEQPQGLLVTRMDLTANDIPLRGVGVRSYPALWLWPAGGKGRPLEYAAYNHEREGARGHSHYELGMVVDFLTRRDHAVRHPHTDGGYFDHLFDNEDIPEE